MTEPNGSPEPPGGEQAAQFVNAQPQEPPSHTGEAKELDKEARMWAMFCHLAGVGGLLPVLPIIGGIIAPLVIWQLKKDDYDFVDDQGREAVNFQLSVLLYALVALLLCFACVGFGLLLIVYGLDVVFVVIAAIKANDGRRYRYPLTIRFIK